MRGMWMAAASLALLLPVTASGQDAPALTQEGAARIETALKDWFTRAIERDEAGVEISLASPITVEVGEDAYVATVPPTTMVSPDLRINWGTVTVEIAPRTEDIFDLSWTVPERIDVSDSSGTHPGVILIGGQTGTAVWSAAYGALLSLDAEWSDVSAIPAEGPSDNAEIRAAAVRATMTSEETAPGVFDFAYEGALAGVLIIDRREDARIDVGEVRLGGGFDGLRLAAYMDFVQTVQALYQQYPADRFGRPDPAVYADVSAMLQEIELLFAGVSGAVTVEGVDVVFGDDFKVEFDSAGLAIEIAGLDQPMAQIGLVSGHEALAVSSEFEAVTPEDVRVDLTLRDIPTEEYGGILLEVLDGAALLGPQTAGFMAIEALGNTLSVAETALVINEIHVDAPAIGVDVDGELRSNWGTSSNPLVGHVEIVLRRFETFLSALQSYSATRDGVPLIAFAGTVGQIEEDPETGELIRRYLFEFEPDGAVLLNGNDLMPLLGGMR